MSWLEQALNWILLALGNAAQWLWHDGLGHVGAGLAWVGHTVNPVVAPLLTWLEVVINPVAGWLLAPVGALPGWLSNTILSAFAGVVLLWLFKYTSNQEAIGDVKDDIKANLLALKLFKDELAVTFRSQGRVFLGALRLLRYSLMPLLVMIVPVTLALAQMGLWYQQRPLQPGETTLVTVKLGGPAGSPLPPVSLTDPAGAEVLIGPLRIPSRREVCWQIRAGLPGLHRLVFEVQQQRVEKQLAVGDGLMRVSAVRPPWDWTLILLHPLESPFRSDGLVQEISIDYPSRSSWTSGTDWWVGYFFVASMVFALLFKPILGVKF